MRYHHRNVCFLQAPAIFKEGLGHLGCDRNVWMLQNIAALNFANTTAFMSLDFNPHSEALSRSSDWMLRHKDKFHPDQLKGVPTNALSIFCFLLFLQP